MQADLPTLHALVYAEAARLRGVSLETMITDWIERGRTELAGDGDTVLRTCCRLAEWERLGYTGAETAALGLACDLARA